MTISLHDLHAVVTTQIPFVGALQATLADVVALLVLALATLDVILTHLAQTAEQVATDLARVLACCALHSVEALKVVLLETELSLLGNVVDDESWRTWVGSRIAKLTHKSLL